MRWFSRNRETQTVELTVSDVRCAHCEASVKLALSSVNGVLGVKVHRRQKRVVVTVGPEHPAPVQELVAALTTRGYRAESP
jgi:copper chaperone CopZ